ncbi:MAG TPA: hypothetical protein VN224_05355, partial [Xanthomonadales bacterium]|nr:hypothetical protein [Xanthomonadales bacterium]
MTEKSAMREGGFTLVEIVIAVAIVAATVAAGFGISLGSRSLAVSTAAGEFDQFLDSARTIARDLDGATLAFTPDAYGDGTEVRVLAGGPNGQPTRTTLPVLHARATIEEVESLGKAPFAFIVHANGSLSGRPGYRVGDTTTNDVGCPPSGAFHFVIKAAGGSADRYVPCRTTLAANGPATLTAWPPATTAPLPTPCSGTGCTATSLPSVPTSTPSCPPTFTPTAGGCAPGAAPGSGARYHVTITGAPLTINVGATGAFTAQATLTNANAVPSGTPQSIPVETQTADTTCAATPPGWQPSGSAFTLTGASAGTCTVTAQADASAIPGATTDTASLTVTITAVAGATPTPVPPQCDLVTNGKCYRRIVDRTTQAFYKYVLPDTQCGFNTCWYIDSIRQIFLDPTYAVLPPATPIPDRELLFKINAIQSVTKECEPFSAFSSVSGVDPIQWSGSVIGGPVVIPLGLGEPSVYATVNHFSLGST